jgi:hypothetical protein
VELKEFKIKHLEFCNEYNEKLDMYYRCGEYLAKKERTEKEIKIYNEYLIKCTQKLSLMLKRYKSLANNEMPSRIVLGGFLLYDKKDNK